jgi:hypothetical protein
LLALDILLSTMGCDKEIGPRIGGGEHLQGTGRGLVCISDRTRGRQSRPPYANQKNL